MNITAPLIVDEENIWLFITYDEHSHVDAFRLGISLQSGDYFFFSTCSWNTDTVIPVLRNTGEPVHSIRWADTQDLENNPLPLGLRKQFRQ